MTRFHEVATEIDGIFYIKKNVIGDSRGYLERLYCVADLKSWSHRSIAQINKTYTKTKGTLRGLHFQYPPYAEAKFICCLRGSVMDFSIDMRKDSRSYGHTFEIKLEAELHNAVLIPEGIAHGFQALTDNVEMLYIHSRPYNPSLEAGVNILDPDLSLQIDGLNKIISERDKNFPIFKEIGGLLL